MTAARVCTLSLLLIGGCASGAEQEERNLASSEVLYEVRASSRSNHTALLTLVENAHVADQSEIALEEVGLGPHDALGRSMGEYCVIEELRRTRKYEYVASSSLERSESSTGHAGAVPWRVRFTNDVREELDWHKRMRDRDALLRRGGHAGLCGKMAFSVVEHRR